MGKYIVHVHQVYVQEIEVEANSPEEARQKVLAGEGEMSFGDKVLLDTLKNPEEWVVESSDP